MDLRHHYFLTLGFVACTTDIALMTNKHILRVVYIVYAIAVVALLIIPRAWVPDFYRPRFMAGVSTAAAICIALPGWIFRPDSAHKQLILERCQLAIAFCMLVNGVGGLGAYKLYKYGVEYDKILHFFVSTIFVVGVAYFLVHWFHKSRKFAITFSVLSVVIGGILWEGWEVAQDKMFGTQTAGVYGEDYVRDTTLDVFADIGGSILGAYLILRESKRFTQIAESKKES